MDSEKLNYIRTNKSLWNKRTDYHFNSQFYNLDGFIKGESSHVRAESPQGTRRA